MINTVGTHITRRRQSAEISPLGLFRALTLRAHKEKRGNEFSGSTDAAAERGFVFGEEEWAIHAWEADGVRLVALLRLCRPWRRLPSRPRCIPTCRTQSHNSPASAQQEP